MLPRFAWEALQGIDKHKVSFIILLIMIETINYCLFFLIGIRKFCFTFNKIGLDLWV